MTDKSIEKIQNISVEAVKALSDYKVEPEWLRQRRLEAWRIYEETPMPTLKDEEWRRTDIRGLKLDELVPWWEHSLRVESIAAVPATLQPLIAEGTSQGGLVVHNSGPIYSGLEPSLAAKGIILTDLDTAVREYPEIIRDYLMTHCLPPTYSKFAALHGAFFSGGSLFYLPPGVEVDLPFHSLLGIDSPGRAAFSHTLIILDKGASASFLDEYFSSDLGGQSFHCGVVEIYLKEGARFFYMSLQNWGKEIYDISMKRAVQDRDTNLIGLGATFGGELAKANVETLLQGPGSTAQLLGLYFSSRRQLFDHHTLQDHISHHAKSDLLYKGVLTDRSRTVYSGLIRVHPLAQKTDAYQANRNLILSDKARADSIPNLEIMANDVRCTHGATVGQIDSEQLFYLMSRGLGEPEATKLIVDGFFAPVLERIPWEGVRGRVVRLIEGKMPQALGDGSEPQS